MKTKTKEIHPPLGWHQLDSGESLQFIQTHLDRQTWDVSIQKPTRRILGRVSFDGLNWFVDEVVVVQTKTRIYNQKCTDNSKYCSWEQAALALKDMADAMKRDINLARLKLA